MRTRADIDREIASERQAIAQLNKGQNVWSKTKDRERRDEHVLELWEMGVSVNEIAAAFDLSAPRIRQIVNSIGGAI